MTARITALLTLTALILSASPAPAWELEEFVVYLWGTPQAGSPEARARALADAGFTVVDWPADGLDVLADAGLRGMVHGATPDIARRIARHPALWGYHLRDEPYPESQFVDLAQRVAELRTIDPDHPGFVNMLSTTGHFLREYLRLVQPEILSFDYYQWWWGSDRYFEKLEQFRDAALAAGVPLGSCVEATANPGAGHEQRAHLADNAVRLRQSVYTNLAYGVKSIEWFSQAHVFEPASLELSATGRDVAALNAELAHVGPVLAGLRSIDVHHTRPLPLGTRTAPTEYWVRLIGEPSRAGLVLGALEDDAGTDYLLVANRDIHAPQSVTMRFQSRWLGIAPWHEPKTYSYGVERLDKATGAWQLVSSSSFVGFTFVIAAGDGDLFRVHIDVEEPDPEEPAAD